MRVRALLSAGLLPAAMLLVLHAASFAGVVPVPGRYERSSHVEEEIAPVGGGLWTYSYTLFNDSELLDEFEFTPSQSRDVVDSIPFIVDWELPWFSDALITAILSPPGWDHSIETIGEPNPATGWAGEADWQDPADPFFMGPNSPFTSGREVLHWYSLDWNAEAEWPVFPPSWIPPGSSLGGFGFTAPFSPLPAPYQASWAAMPILTGDPGFPGGGGSVPASPLATVPEPGSLALFALGLGALWIARRRRR